MYKAVIIAIVGALVAPTFAFARPIDLYIPRLSVTTKIASNLSRGPVVYFHDSDTLAIAGHDVTPVPGFNGHGPFRYIANLRRGDLIRMQGNDYRVIKHKLVRPNETWVLNWSGVVISTCYPPHSDSFRYVIFAR